MSKLKFKTNKVINCFDFDILVKETYERHYCYQQQDGCKPKGNHNFSVPETCDENERMHDKIPEIINGIERGVKFKVWLDRDVEEWNGEKADANYLYLFWERNFYPDFGTIVNDLYGKGLIEAGEYTMEIDW